MKKTVSMLIAIILLLSVLPIANFAQAAAPGTYNPGDIAVINRMIDNNGLKLPKAPEDGSSVPGNWVVVNWNSNSTNKRITDLFMGNHGLTGSLDLRGLDYLEWMYCQNNSLTALDVSNTGVSYLYCQQNQLTTLDMSNTRYLVELRCEENRLTALNVRSNSLMRLYCYNNQLTTLDVSGSNNLKYLDCRYNYLPSVNAVIGHERVSSFYFDPQKTMASSDTVIMRIDQLYAAVDGDKVKVSEDQDMTPIFNDGGRTMVPFRFIATCFGAEVGWDQNLGSAVIDRKGKSIVLPIDMPYAYVDGVQTEINAPAQIMTFGRTFVPFRVVSELLGGINLDYDPVNMTIIASTGEIDVAACVALYDSMID